MKLIIDIPEDVITAIQNGEDYRYDIHTTIAQGIPYEERSQGEWVTDELCRLRSCLRSGLHVGSCLNTQNQMNRFIAALDEVISADTER